MKSKKPDDAAVDALMVLAHTHGAKWAEVYEQRRKRLLTFLEKLPPCQVIADALLLQLEALRELGVQPFDYIKKPKKRSRGR